MLLFVLFKSVTIQVTTKLNFIFMPVFVSVLDNIDLFHCTAEMLIDT